MTNDIKNDFDSVMQDLSYAVEHKQVNNESTNNESICENKPLASTPRRRRVVPEVIQDIVALGVGARFDESLAGWVIPGFYKARGLLIRYDEQNNNGIAVPLSNKRSQGHPIKNFDDLVELNYAWWNASRKESLEFENPEDAWKEEFVEREMVERRMLFIPKASTFNPTRS